MRRLILLCLLMMLAMMISASAETLTFNGLLFDSEDEYIDLGNNTIKDMTSFYAFLNQFTNLQKVDMFATPVRRSQIEAMTAMYPEIEFGWTMQFAEHTLRTDATAFSTLHYSKDQKHGNADISLVRYCKHLKALDFGHNSVTDLSFLYDLPELRVLIIACNQVEDITPIGSLKQLEYLELFTNNIRDISPLEGLTNLMDLNISYNYISDISPILSLKNLKRLWTCRSVNRGMNVSLSNEQIEQIKQAIPGIREINNLSSPTGGTWREHPHFDVIHRMFRAEAYEPFEDSFLAEGDQGAFTVALNQTQVEANDPENESAQDAEGFISIQIETENGQAGQASHPAETELQISPPTPEKHKAGFHS